MPVDFSVPDKDGARRRRGVRLRWSTVPAEDTVSYQSRLMTNRLRTAVDLARWSRTPARTLAAVDLCLRYGLATAPQLRAFLPMMKRRQGIPLVRAAAGIGTIDAESPKEKRAALLLAGIRPAAANRQRLDL